MRVVKKVLKEGVYITGVSLVREGDDAVVSVEVNGRWVAVIVEGCDGLFSHIVEPAGIKRAVRRGRGRS